MPKRTRQRALPPSRPIGRDVELRIIGGTLRGRRFRYHGDPTTRPMKDRVREAIFNLLGPRIREKHAVDLFGGTGALGFEALSRGATRATIIEQHFPTARLIRDNARSLALDDRVTVLEGDAFFFGKNLSREDDLPWVVFCSPPYEFYVSRSREMTELLEVLLAAAPPTSLFIVESDERLDPRSLPEPDGWDVRLYRPALVALIEWPQPAAQE